MRVVVKSPIHFRCVLHVKSRWVGPDSMYNYVHTKWKAPSMKMSMSITTQYHFRVPYAQQCLVPYLLVPILSLFIRSLTLIWKGILRAIRIRTTSLILHALRNGNVLKGTGSIVVIWVQNFQTEFMVEI